MRTSWSDTNAIFVGFKAGSASVNHAHMDIGSFILDAQGTRWAMDFGMQNYESLESRGLHIFGRTQDAPRWKIFRMNNLAHNTLTVDGQYQRVKGNAPITASSASPGFMYAITDMTTVYDSLLKEARRGVALVDGQYLLVRDEIRTLGNETHVRWTMATPAAARITGANTLELTKDGKTMLLTVEQPSRVEMKTWSTDPPNDYDAPNPGTVLVGFETVVPANTSTTFQVTISPGKTSAKQKKKVPSLKDWTSK